MLIGMSMLQMQCNGFTQGICSEKPKADFHVRLCYVCCHAGSSEDPLNEVAALHAQFLTPKHLRRGKGGRQPAVPCLLCCLLPN